MYKLDSALVLLSMGLSGLFESANLAALYPLIHYGLPREMTSSMPAAAEKILNFFGNENLFISSCLLLIVITILTTVFKIVYNVYANNLIRKIVTNFQKNIFFKYSKADYRFFLDNQQGRLIYAATVAPIGLSNNVFSIIRLLYTCTACIFFLALLAFISWKGVALMLTIGSLYFYITRQVTANVIRKASLEVVEQDRKKNVVLNEFITGIKFIKTSFGSSYIQKKYFDAVEKSALGTFRVMTVRIIPDTLIKSVFYLGLALLGIAMFFHGSKNILPFIPALGTFTAVTARLFPYLNLIGNDIVSIFRYMPDTRIVSDIICEEMQSVREGDLTLAGFHRNVEFKNVVFKYSNMDSELLKNISFFIEKKKITAIVGKSGSGKSSIVNLLLRLYDPDQGSILLDGIDIRKFTYSSYLSKFAFITQETFIFNGTIRENIQFDLHGVSDEQIVQASKLASAHDFIAETERGYETIVGDAGMKLSGGQRQRIAIARAILRNPEIIIFDEATSALDSISERQIQNAISQISNEMTVLIIAHRLSTVRNADKILVVDDGRIIEEGTHDALLLQNKIYTDLYKGHHIME